MVLSFLSDKDEPLHKRQRVDDWKRGTSSGYKEQKNDELWNFVQSTSCSRSESRSSENGITQDEDTDSDETDSDSNSDASSADYEGEVFSCWKCDQKVSSGNNGQVYIAGLSDCLPDIRVALKVETRSSKKSHIKNEVQCLQKLRCEKGFPRVLDSGILNCKLWMTMDLLGPSLRWLYEKYVLDEDIITFLADQMLDRMEALHKQQYVHLSVKPDNFCLCVERNNVAVYMIDFGRCESFVDNNGKHISYSDNKGGPFSRWYHSAGALKGKRQSRRDDMISLAYSIVYFFKGDEFINWREDLPAPELVDVADHYGDSLPLWVNKFLKHCTGLNWEDQPDYNMLRGLIRSRFRSDAKIADAKDFLMYATRRHFERLQSKKNDARQKHKEN